MTTFITAIEKNLIRGIELLNCISDEEYGNMSVPPYYSSIGGHMRHILDVFDCVFEGIESKQINLIKTVISRLLVLSDVDMNQIVEVTDDLGLGVVSANYTLAGILIQAHSHAIHHFASVGYIIAQLGIDLPDDDFGFNPTTPKTTNSF